MRTAVVNWEWDETSQRLRPLRVKSLKGERQPQHQASVQMMVQQGLLTVYLYQRSDWLVASRSPYFVKGLLLQKQNADFLLQAILQSFLVDLLDVALINDLASTQEAIIINLCCDRASPNILLAKTMFKILSSPAVDSSILGHLEPCGAHGVALVKARAAMSKDISSSCSSFTCLTKNWRFMEELRNTTIRIVEKNLKVKRERRPAGHVEGGRAMVAALLGIESVESLSRENKSGHFIVGCRTWRSFAVGSRCLRNLVWRTWSTSAGLRKAAPNSQQAFPRGHHAAAASTIQSSELRRLF